MKTSIRKRLISKINQVEDEQLLSGLYDILKDESKKEIHILSDDQLRRLQKARAEINRGDYLTDAEVKRRSALWLGK